LKKFVLLLVLLVSVGCSAVQAGTDYCTNTINANQTAIFFPRAGQYVSPVIVDLYNKADKTIDVAIYALNDPQIVIALKNAASRGVRVRVITDRKEALDKYQRIALDDLLFAHVSIKVNSHPNSMHLKMSIVDNKLATTGSYDYTLEANQINDEMFIIVTEPKFVQICINEFERLWESDKGIVNYP
jgi:phosphatidylserine/phosphatidylglycerophosphate/cardiolipin synthase-like enzyme